MVNINVDVDISDDMRDRFENTCYNMGLSDIDKAIELFIQETVKRLEIIVEMAMKSFPFYLRSDVVKLRDL